MTDDERNEQLLKAEKYDQAKDEVGKEYVNNVRYLKTDLSAWYNALTTACFTVGAIAITIGADNSVKVGLVHPGYFWWGTVLLILDGILIFFLKKQDIEGEFNEMPKLTESKADYWELRNLTAEKANGDNANAKRLTALEKKVTGEYVNSIKKWSWYKWAYNTIKAATTDIVFGLFLFPIALMLTQIIDELHISIGTYRYILQLSLSLYIIYAIRSGIVGVKVVRRKQFADQRIAKLIFKKALDED